MRQKLASIAFLAPPPEDRDRLLRHALDRHVGAYVKKGWELSISLLDAPSLSLMREMMDSGREREAADLSLYTGSILAEEWLFGRHRLCARRLLDPELGESFLFLWE